jgi:AmmeMemoRadiSam system protein B
MQKRIFKFLLVFLLVLMTASMNLYAQIPMDRVLSRVTIPAEDDTRGLVDTVGFPHRADQMDFIGQLCEKLERQAIVANQQQLNFTDNTALIFGICPHDDYKLAARVYFQVQQYMKAKIVILIGNAHWSEAFAIRNKLIFGDFKYWHGPYGPVKISAIRDQITKKLSPRHYVVKRTVVETEHSLEALIPFLQYFNRDVEIVPILVPFTDWKTMNELGADLAQVVSEIIKNNGWSLGQDIAILCSTDGQHYGDYGWSYYDYHPYGCDADGYKKATALDQKMINDYLVGPAQLEKIHQLFASLVDQTDISNYKVTWCGRFYVSFASNFAIRLVKQVDNRELIGSFLGYGSSLSDQWLPLEKFNLGLTGDANLHHFVTYFAVGFK